MRQLTLAAWILAPAFCLAQDPRGAIIGQITDPAGAPIPGVTVRATNLATNVAASALTNAQGNFEAPYLLVGEYRVATELAGFKTWSRSGVAVRLGERLRLDIQLEMGDVKEMINVTAQPPVLETAAAGIGQVIGSRQFSDMPLRGGSISWLYGMAPAAVLTSLPTDGPWNITQSSGVSVAGAGAGGIDFNVDGISNNSYNGQTAFVPPPDMVGEVKISTTSYDAAAGHTTGASIDVSLKSGSNELHGALSASVSSGPMMTRNFFTNGFIFDPTTGPITPEKIKANTPSVRWLRTAAAAGGPVYLPRLYDGRNKTFWMFGYQSHERRAPGAGVYTAPTEAQRNGDFSALLGLGRQYQIYDPFTTRPSGSNRFQRQPVPGNRIPANRIDPTARNILKYFPAPNGPGTADFLNNYSRTRQDTQDLYQPVVKVDHVFSEGHRMFARYSHSDFYGLFDKLIEGSDVRGRRRMRPHRGLALDDVVVLNPRMVLDVRYGFTWFREWESFDNIGFNLAEFGFPQSLVSQLDPRGASFPALTVSGMLPLGNDGGFSRKNYTHSLLTVMNWSKGNHAVKYGFDGRLMFENNTTFGNVSPAMNFTEAYTRGPLDNSPIAPNGQAFASYLFGIPSGGGADRNDSRAEASRFNAVFVQDDWRLTRRLTLNLGLRWEVETPTTERFNRSTRDFDFHTANPIQAQARANYTRAPIPQMPVSQFSTSGGVTFTGTSGNPRGIRDPYYRALMPRFGLAWQTGPRIVLRGGYGLYFGLLGAEFTDVSQPGFNQRTNIVPTLDSGQTYVASISNPLPSGINQPLGAAGGLRTFLGRSPGFFAADGRRPYTQRWSASVQFEPLERTVVEVGYIGSRSTRLRVSTNLNPVPEQYLSKSPVRDQQTIDLLSGQVANPFNGIDGFQGTEFFAGVNTARSQLLRPFPHFADLITGLPAGSSWYHAMSLRFERRLHAGLLLQSNYTWSKTMEAAAYRTDIDRIPEQVVSDLDRPHRITFASIYELPFGRGKRFGAGVNGFANQVIGGWQLQAMFQGQSGPPLAFGNVIYTGTYPDLKLPGGERRVERWFNTNGFERNAQRQLASNVRTFPTRIASVRADGIKVWDLSVHKNFRVREAVTVQLRGEAEGATNTPNFRPPNTVPTSTLFGRVTNTATNQEERRIFVMLKLIF